MKTFTQAEANAAIEGLVMRIAYVRMRENDRYRWFDITRGMIYVLEIDWTNKTLDFTLRHTCQNREETESDAQDVTRYDLGEVIEYQTLIDSLPYIREHITSDFDADFCISIGREIENAENWLYDITVDDMIEALTDWAIEGAHSHNVPLDVRELRDAIESRLFFVYDDD